MLTSNLSIANYLIMMSTINRHKIYSAIYTIVALTTFVISNASSGASLEENSIKEIREIYSRTYKLVERNKTSVIKIYSEAGQDGYVIKKWHLADDKQEYEQGAYEVRVFVLEGKIIKTRVVTQSLSGDWAQVTEYYYYPDGEVAFIFEGNTTYNGYLTESDKDSESQGPFVIEKRSYFTKDGKRIRFLKKAYLKRTGQSVPIDQIQDVKLQMYGPACTLPFIELVRKRVKVCD